MSDEEAEVWRQQSIGTTNYRVKLREARERKGWSIHETAAQMESSLGSKAGYYDIEDCDRDFTSCYSLNEIFEISKILDIHPRDLFCNEAYASISISDVVERIKEYCAERKSPSVNLKTSLAGVLKVALPIPRTFSKNGTLSV